jgi:PAS domain S-box-containing protein
MRLDTDAEPVAAIREAIDAQEQVTVELRNYRKSGEPFWNRVSIAPVYDETGQLRNYVGFQEDITDRKERIEKLRQYETIVETTGDTTAVLDENGRFELVNGRLADIYDATPEELQGEQARLVTYLREQHSGVYEDLVDGRRESFRTELELTYPTHGTRHADIRMTRLASDGEFRGIVVVGRDISDRKQYERSLSALYEAITEFVGAATRPEAVEHVVSAMSDAADLPNAAVYLYDEDEGVLRPERLSPDGADLVGTPPTIGPGEGVAWRVFAVGETVLYDDVREAEDVYNPETPVRSELIVPLGEHGILIAGDPRPGAFDERNREFAEIIAAAAEATLDSVAQTERLRERTRELDRQMTRLDRVNDLNGAIRRINRAVVDADSREAIVETVCDRLVDLGTIEFAWVGEPAPDAGQLSLGAWAGADRSYLDMREFPIDGTDSADPSLATARSQDVTYVPDIVRRAQAGEWQTAALQQGYKSVLSVPLAYDDSLYGVLTVFAPRQDLFDDAFRTILTELGELVGLGLNALDRRDALLGRRHTTVELEFDSGDTDDPLFSLTQALDCTVEISTILPRDDASLVYAECTAVTEQQVQTTVTDLPGIREVRRVRGTDPCESEPCLFEFLVTDAGFLSDLARHGVRSQTVTFEGDRSRIVAVVPSTVDPGTLVDDLRARWPGLELAGRGIEHEAATASSAFLLTSELTAAQQEAVEAAYEAGFFEWPRDSTSEDIAAALGISQPAFAQRLRAAESKLFDAYCRGVRRQSAGRLRS